MNSASFATLLQLSISPIALISGAGLLLLSITNRLGRAIDRLRDLANSVDENDQNPNSKLNKQVDVFIRRSEFLRNSVFFTGFSIFLSTLTILGLFLRLFAEWQSETFVLLFLFLSVGCLCIAVAFFLLDVSFALKAIKVELSKHTLRK